MPRTYSEMRTENGRAWDIVGRCWIAWFILAFGGLLLTGVSEPLGIVVIGIGFGAVLYAGYVVTRYSRRQRRFLKEKS